MNYIEIPNTGEAIGESVFLAGGITGCRDWRAEVVAQLMNSNLTLFNPLRPNFPIDDPSASVFQIQWEHEYLRKATAILFWFPAETLCPITLYELGAWSMTTKPLFVGVHPDYARIAAWVRADAPFTPENGLLTPNGRLRRAHIFAAYAQALERLWSKLEN